MFTDRFIKIPVELYDSKQAELVGFNENTKTGEVLYRINPMEITVYRETTEEGELTRETTIWLKDGQSIVIAITIDEFEKLLNSHG